MNQLSYVELLALYREIFESDKGQIVLDNLVGQFYDIPTINDINKPDALSMAYHEGQRSVVRFILQALITKGEK